MTGRYPRRFGKYVLLKPLAKGGMGEVYVAAGGEIGGFEKLCVIKKVLSEKTDQSKANRFLDEAKVVLRLSHAALVTTFDAGTVDGEFYIAMELVEGKDLREVWNRCVRTRQRIPLDVALHVVREVARALTYVHAYGALKLVHRDVAPPNILLAYVGDVKLTDFGLARSVLKQEHTAPGVVFGRAAYLAPEQARGEVADARTDVYTLGIVLWELLTGQQFLQISGLDPAAALAIVRHPKLVPPSARAPWLTPALDQVVTKALATDRAQRYQSADEMRRALSDVIATMAPRAGADRVSEFLHTIYTETIAEEAQERERFLRDEIPRFRADSSENGAQDSGHRGDAPSPRERPPSDPPTLAARLPAAARPANVKVGVRSTTPAPRSPTRMQEGAKLGSPPLPGLPPSLPAAHASRSTYLPGSAPGAFTAPPPTPAPTDPGPDTQQEMAAVDAANIAANAAANGPTQTDFVGRLLGGRYRVQRMIGEGGMGRVYAAEHVEIGKGVAVKVLHPACSTRSDLVERFRREARAASKIGHPNIVNVTDFGTTEEGLVYYVMEQLAGVDLADVLAQEGRIEPLRTMQIGVQICQALQAAHAADIVHRDLKPENIFLQPRGSQGDLVKILDFGLARSLEPDAVVTDGRRLTNPGMPIGTPEYMAPEQAEGRPADARADIYALGAILYEIVSGTPAFSGTGYADILARKSSEDPQPPSLFRPDVPPELEQLILSMLERDREHRPQTMAQVEYALTKMLRGRGQAVAALLGIERPGSNGAAAESSSVEMEMQDRRRTKRDAAFKAIAALDDEARQAGAKTPGTPHPQSLLRLGGGAGPAQSPHPPRDLLASPFPPATDALPVTPLASLSRGEEAAMAEAVAGNASPSPTGPASAVPPRSIGEAMLSRYGVDQHGHTHRGNRKRMMVIAAAAVALTIGVVLATRGSGKGTRDPRATPGDHTQR